MWLLYSMAATGWRRTNPSILTTAIQLSQKLLEISVMKWKKDTNKEIAPTPGINVGAILSELVILIL